MTGVRMARWREPATIPPLEPDHVDVWLASTRVDSEQMRTLEECLTRDERRRANRFALDRPRQAFVVVRGLLRVLLAAYLKQRPSAIVLSYEPKGKPVLVGSGLGFNVSHSGDLALVSLTWGRRVGVDIERIRRPVPLEVAARFFSPREQELMRSLPPSARTSAFFTCWTRKEAYLKATGEGLSVSPGSFSVSAQSDCLAGPRCAAEAEAVEHWSLHDLPAIAGHAAALAVDGFSYLLRCWRWPTRPLLPERPCETRPEPLDGQVAEHPVPTAQRGRDETQSTQRTVVLEPFARLDRTAGWGELGVAR
jgi:4'-phosphopantetheinyl transferase